MQLVYAGSTRLILLELEADLLRQGATELGFECEVSDLSRMATLDLEVAEGETPLLLFDAADPANGGWFSRCQFYVDGRTGAVLQTPFLIANRWDERGRLMTRALRLQIRKELPHAFRLPGQQPVNEKMLYAVLFNFLQALRHVGVALCGPGVVRPLAGRTEGSR
jgi:hypothetical protein